MKDMDAIQTLLEPILEVLQQYVLADDSEDISPELRGSVATAIGEARYLQLDEIQAALEKLETLLEAERPDVQELLPLLFSLQETTQNVSVEIPPEERSKTDETDAYIEWDRHSDLEDVAELDEQSRFLLDGALSRGLKPYVIRINTEGSGLALSSIASLIERDLSVVNTIASESTGRLALLIVGVAEPAVDRILEPFLREGAAAINFNVEKLDPALFARPIAESRPWYQDLPPIEITLKPAALDRMRFFISRLETTISEEDRPLVKELSQTLESSVSVSLRDIVDGLTGPLETLAAERRKPVLISFGGTVDHIPAEMSEALCEALRELLKNAIEHGIEDEEARKKAGKKPRGMIRVFGSTENDALTIRVTDDGHGITESEIRRSINRPAGAGGLARVRRALQQRFGGSINVKSGGKGSTVTLRIPSSQGSWTALLCERRSKPFVVPAVLVAVVLPVGPADFVGEASGGRFLRYRDRLLTLVEPHQSNYLPDSPSKVVVLSMHSGEFALALDGEAEEVAVVPDGPGTVRVLEREIAGVPVAIRPPA